MTTLTLLVIIGLAATVLTLVTGVGAMAHGGRFDRRHSVQLMFTRVGVQGVTLVLVLIALLMSAR